MSLWVCLSKLFRNISLSLIYLCREQYSFDGCVVGLKEGTSFSVLCGSSVSD